MAKYVDSEVVKGKLSRTLCLHEELPALIDSIPAADVRPVVLCKDCMHWEYDAIFVDGWCRVRRQGNPNWYCADGEKREES